MAKKTVKMTLSAKGYKNFKAVMRKMKFNNADLFLRYCVLNTAKSKLTKTQKKAALKEMKMIKGMQKKKR